MVRKNPAPLPTLKISNNLSKTSMAAAAAAAAAAAIKLNIAYIVIKTDVYND
jgi:hypothetical protein